MGFYILHKIKEQFEKGGNINGLVTRSDSENNTKLFTWVVCGRLVRQGNLCPGIGSPCCLQTTCEGDLCQEVRELDIRSGSEVIFIWIVWGTTMTIWISWRSFLLGLSWRTFFKDWVSVLWNMIYRPYLPIAFAGKRGVTYNKCDAVYGSFCSWWNIIRTKWKVLN